MKKKTLFLTFLVTEGTRLFYSFEKATGSFIRWFISLPCEHMKYWIAFRKFNWNFKNAELFFIYMIWKKKSWFYRLTCAHMKYCKMLTFVSGAGAPRTRRALQSAVSAGRTRKTNILFSFYQGYILCKILNSKRGGMIRMHNIYPCYILLEAALCSMVLLLGGLNLMIYKKYIFFFTVFPYMSSFIFILKNCSFRYFLSLFLTFQIYFYYCLFDSWLI